MRSLLPFLITGVFTGSLYGLAGLGLVITYRTSGVFNFGHGAIAAAAAFFFYTLHVSHGVAWPAAAVLTVLVFGLGVGTLMELITRRLEQAPQAVAVVATIGILLAVEGWLFLQYGDVTRHFPAFLPTTGFTVAGVVVSWSEVISVAVAAIAAVGLQLFLRNTRLGIAMRASVSNPTLLSLTGERPTRVRRLSWIIGSAFAAISGILLAPTLGLDANLLTLLVVQAFGACAIGMFSSLPLTYAGGLLVGVITSVATKYLIHEPFTGLPATVPFLVLVVTLLVIPTRRLPQQRSQLRRIVARRPAPPSRTVSAALAVALGLVLVPTFVGTRLPIWTSGLVYVVVFGSLALLVWTSGQISLCHAAFVALGATTFGHLTRAGLPWGLALLGAGLLTVPVGALVAIPAIRLSGLYLALATLGFGILMQDVFFQTKLMFGSNLYSPVTATRPRLAFVHGADNRWFYYVVLAVAAAVCVGLALITRGRLGRLLRGLAEAPTMLATHGVAVNLTRLIVFCLSAFVAGIGGALMISQARSVDGVAFGPIQSIMLLAVLAICGTGLLSSSLLAAAIFAVLPGYATSFGVDRQTLAFGIVAVVAALIAVRRAELASRIRFVVARGAAGARARCQSRPTRWSGRDEPRRWATLGGGGRS